MGEWERFEDLDGLTGYAQQLVDRYGAELLSEPPASFSDVPGDKALVWVVHMTRAVPPAPGDVPGDKGFVVEIEYYGPDRELAYYVWDDGGFGVRLRDDRPAEWLLVDRETADRLVPDAGRYRRDLDESIALDAECAAHPDNLLPVARASRFWVEQYVMLLRRYAGALLGEADPETRTALILDPVGGAGVRQIAADDLRRLADDMESWLATGDYVALLKPDPVAGRPGLVGPLPPFPAVQPG